MKNFGNVIIIKPEDLPIQTKKEINLQLLQDTVEGYIEALEILPNIVLWCNEEGKLRRFQDNIKIIKNGHMYDIIAGNAIITGVNAEGDTIPLTEDQRVYIMRRFSYITRPNHVYKVLNLD